MPNDAEAREAGCLNYRPPTPLVQTPLFQSPLHPRDEARTHKEADVYVMGHRVVIDDLSVWTSTRRLGR
ncbi:hypothetical protein [uncultured Roseobacter sp.]|uniref:hypothetical protein n=1 Tax=uncultured Roseobacter sp. TaxID=114847 RepID=UPI002632BFD8|nr:hypothetical protein [uncultured Roseobacter sp.]